ncbi:C1 family peptidase [uncultured Roseibium sp.]|uniref:C1 family peptidase n=1 Tax=uncultured Roseibium sp. TaxID=1936171 RepID=UPI002612F235|nr:C1 family peptidase [uncultured Roseibium sp.]
MVKPASTLYFGGTRLLETSADVGDVRDYLYKPTLAGLAPRIDPRDGTAPWWSDERIRDQGNESSCTAHALAGIIDHLRARDRMLNLPKDAPLPAEDRRSWASADMLYNIARFHDEFPGESYSGSSIRGALKAFYFNGACSEAVTRGLSDQQWHMTREILESARRVQLGAYYRVRPRLSDVHAALNEAGLVLASADLHPGWATDGGRIPFGDRKAKRIGRHAFILVGYTEEGFLVQNSWGPEWGDKGVALWSYEDWSANVVDMWVLRLAVQVASKATAVNPLSLRSRGLRLGEGAFDKDSLRPATPPTRFDVLGHIASTSRGRLDRYGAYHVDPRTLQETVRILQDSPKYKHVLVHFMGLQRHENATMAAIRDAVPVFKSKGIYPFFVTVENELSSTVHDMVEAEVERANVIAGLGESQEKDRRIEGRLSASALRIVEEIQRSSMSVVYGNGDGRLGEGLDILNDLFSALGDRHRRGEVSYHLSAHGFGASLLAALLSHTQHWSRHPVLSSISLYAPMLTVQTVRESFLERLVHPKDLPLSRRARGDDAVIEHLDLYLQGKEAMRNDRPLPGYSGNWPQLWTRVLAIAERRANDDYTGIATGGISYCDNDKAWHANLLALGGPANVLADEPGVSMHSLNVPHRDFDLRIDVLDMLLERILGKAPVSVFKTAYDDRASLLVE